MSVEPQLTWPATTVLLKITGLVRDGWVPPGLERRGISVTAARGTTLMLWYRKDPETEQYACFSLFVDWNNNVPHLLLRGRHGSAKLVFETTDVLAFCETIADALEDLAIAPPDPASLKRAYSQT
jgi:hypothetical protein